MAELARIQSRTPAARRKRQRTLKIEYSGNLIKHLGLQMYAGAVPALAELISNAWDADASRVAIDIPFGQSISEDDMIVVADNGRGMSWEDVAQDYLVIGRDRRVQKGAKTPGGRHVMGRKGIGKLAGFGIANIVEVRTVRNKWVTHFLMDYRDMTRSQRSEYIERYEPVVLEDDPCTERNGTKIILRELLITRAIREQDFRTSMARRFAVLSNQFEVTVNGTPIEPGYEDLRYRTPSKGLHTSDVPGFGKVQWWMGITRDTIKTPEGRGVSIFAHGKLVQTPFLFNIHGGMHAQHFAQYLTGEVFADRLDEDKDYIATGRQSVNWDEPVPNALEAWGQQLVRQYISKTYKMSEAEKDRVAFATLDATLSGNLTSRLQRLPDTEQKQARALITSLRKIRETDASSDYAANVADGILSIYEDGVGHWTPAHLLESDDLLKDYGPFDIARVRSILRDRSEFAKQVRSMLKDATRLPNKADLIRDNLWLLTGPATLPLEDPDYTTAVRRIWRGRNKTIADRVDIFAGNVGSARFIGVIERAKPIRATLERWERYRDWLNGEHSADTIFFVAHRQTPNLSRNDLTVGSLDQFCKAGVSEINKITRLLSERARVALKQ